MRPKYDLLTKLASQGTDISNSSVSFLLGSQPLEIVPHRPLQVPERAHLLNPIILQGLKFGAAKHDRKTKNLISVPGLHLAKHLFW